MESYKDIAVELQDTNIARYVPFKQHKCFEKWIWQSIFGVDGFMFIWFSREDKGDQILDYKLEIQTMEEQLKKVQKEVCGHTHACFKVCST